MRPIIWKEIRENFKWAALWMVGMGLAMAYALSQQGAYYYYWEGISICSDVFLLITTIGCALGAALLGLIQVVFEMRNDQWAFLVHRPVSRTTIWLGKVIAGLLLYVAATGIPFLLATLWASSPGNVAAPFDWRMMLPGAADMLCGIVFYFAGMLTGLRQARWYGSRAMGVVAAIFCAGFVVHAAEFWHALIAIVLLGGVLAVAAWGSFLTSSAYRPQPILAKLALGLSLLLGILITGVFGSGIVFAIIAAKFGVSRTTYRIDKEGNILRVKTDYLTVESVTDLEGNPYDKYADKKYRVYDTLSKELLRLVSIRHEGTYRVAPYRDSSRFFVGWGRVGDSVWYYVRDEHRILGYSARAKRLLGSLGPEGFHPPAAATSNRFEGRLLGYGWYGEGVYSFTKAVYEIDLAEEKVELLFAAQGLQEIHGAAKLRAGVYAPYSVESEAPFFVAVAVDDRLNILSGKGETVFTTDLVYDPQQYPNVSVVALPEGKRFFVRQSPSWRTQYVQRAQAPQFIVEYDAEGTELTRHELPPVPYDRTSLWFEPATAVVLPVGALAVLSAHALSSPHLGSPTPYHFFLWLDDQGFDRMTYCLLTLASGLACAMVAYWICARFSFRRKRRLGWTTLVFILGPLGLLLLWALLEWPALERCSACGRKRVVTLEQCQYCQAPFPAPVLDGTEIFEV